MKRFRFAIDIGLPQALSRNVGSTKEGSFNQIAATLQQRVIELENNLATARTSLRRTIREANHDE